jgi:hypothetical protein
MIPLSVSLSMALIALRLAAIHARRPCLGGTRLKEALNKSILDFPAPAIGK